MCCLEGPQGLDVPQVSGAIPLLQVRLGIIYQFDTLKKIQTNQSNVLVTNLMFLPKVITYRRIYHEGLRGCNYTARVCGPRTPSRDQYPLDFARKYSSTNMVDHYNITVAVICVICY